MRPFSEAFESGLKDEKLSSPVPGLSQSSSLHSFETSPLSPTIFFETEETSAVPSTPSEMNDVVALFLSPDAFDETPTKELKEDKVSKGGKGEKSDFTLKELKEGKSESISAYYSKIPPVPQTASFGRFDPKVDQSPGFAAQYSHTNISAAFTRSFKKKLPPLSCSNPAPRAGRFVVGTDVSQSTNYIFCVDAAKWKEGEKHVFCGFTTLSEPVRFTHSLTDDSWICALDRGLMERFVINFDTHEIKSTGKFTDVHKDDVREISAIPDPNPNFIASTGFDGKLCITDLTRKTVVRTTLLNDVGSSVKWHAYHDYCVGCTTDGGVFYLCDIRTGLLQVRKIVCKKPVYTHLRYTPDHIVLGCYDGEIAHYDLRTTSLLSFAEDPYCDGIGMIESNQRDAIVISGYTDFSVWKQETKTNEMNIWSHSKATTKTNIAPEYACYATFIDSDTVLASDSDGFVGFWNQGFDMFDFE